VFATVIAYRGPNSPTIAPATTPSVVEQRSTHMNQNLTGSPHTSAPPDAMRLALMDFDAGAKAFCSARRHNQHGNVVASCSFHPGHENDHRDVHSGATWR
jgi:hypothetical protein